MTPIYLDTTTWVRREAFEYFKGYDKPYFNVCVRLDAAPLKAWLAEHGGSFNLACHYLALRLAQQHEPMRLRLEQGRVRIWPELAASLAMLRDDGSIAFVTLPMAPDWPRFLARSESLLQATRSGQAPFDTGQDEQSLIHFTTLPWLHFTSFSHARNWRREDAIPKIAFGRTQRDGEHLWLPFSVEVHHALMDGLHVGRYVEDLEAAMAAPAPWLQGAP